MGVNNIIRAVQKKHQVSREEAGDAIEGRSEKLDVRPHLETFCKDLGHSLDKSATYLKTSGDAEQLDRIFLSGGGGRIPHLVDVLQEVQPLPVELVNPLRRIQYDPAVFVGVDPEEIAPQLAVGVGLALRKAA